MADKKPTDAPEKTGQAVTGGDKAAPGKQAPPAPEEKAPAPPAGGKEDKAPPAGPADKAPGNQTPPPPGKGKIVGVEFPSGKKIEIVDAPGKAAHEPKAPGGNKKAGPEVTDEGDSLDQWNKEQAALDEKKPGRKPRASKTAEKSGEADKAEKPPARRGRPPKSAGVPGKKTAPAKQEAPPPAPEPPRAPVEAPRPKEPEQIVHISLSELHPFKDHPFGVRDDAEMQALTESVKDKGVDSPALVRPREGGGYEIVAGHRRQRASELAGYKDMPCIVRKMTDDEAILAMTDSNLRQREKILPSEKAISLKMQVEAIKHQGARDTSGQKVQSKDAGNWSNEVVGERNGITGKQVQRFIRLTKLVPDLLKAADEGKLAFTPAVEISFIKPKLQNLIAVSIEGQQSSPSVSQAKTMRELDKKGELNGDTIDGILSQEKKEEIRVIISGAELEKYFGKGKPPQEMKAQIVKLLDDWQDKQKEQAPPEKKADREK